MNLSLQDLDLIDNSLDTMLRCLSDYTRSLGEGEVNTRLLAASEVAETKALLNKIRRAKRTASAA